LFSGRPRIIAASPGGLDEINEFYYTLLEYKINFAPGSCGAEVPEPLELQLRQPTTLVKTTRIFTVKLNIFMAMQKLCTIFTGRPCVHNAVIFNFVTDCMVSFIRKSNHCLECKAGSGPPLYLMMQKRYETEVTKLRQNNPSFFAVIYTCVIEEYSAAEHLNCTA